MSAAAIVPAFNEAETVGDVVRELAGLGLHVIVVDDGSGDNTAELAELAGATVIRFPRNLGIGAALRAGFLAARTLGHTSAVQFDADGQHDVAWLAPLLDPVVSGEADLVVGSRFAGEASYEVSGSRRVAMRVVARVVRTATGLRLSDTSSGFRAFSKAAIDLFSSDYPIDYMDSVEALVIAHRSGLRITEVPVEMHARKGGTPSARALVAIWHTVRAIFSVYVTHSQSRDRSRE
jgi:glycosyltransferase involved in cell wall biosynthesis